MDTQPNSGTAGLLALGDTAAHNPLEFCACFPSVPTVGVASVRQMPPQQQGAVAFSSRGVPVARTQASATQAPIMYEGAAACPSRCHGSAAARAIAPALRAVSPQQGAAASHRPAPAPLAASPQQGAAASRQLILAQCGQPKQQGAAASHQKGAAVMMPLA